MDASDLVELSSLLARETRHRCGSKPSNRKRQETATLILAENGLGDEVKIKRALYTMRRRIAAWERLDRLAAAPVAIK